MKTSDLVNQLLERNKQEPLQLYEPGQTNKRLGEPDEKLTNEAYNKLCELWNKDEKSRGFVKFLIKAFLPKNPLNKILSFSGNPGRCCVLGIKLAGIKEISDLWAPVQLLRAGRALEVSTGKDNYKAAKEFKRKERELFQKMPVEVRNSTIGYFSDKDWCDKYLSGEAYFALMEFVEDCLWGEEEDILYILNHMRLEEKKKEERAKHPGKSAGQKERSPKKEGNKSYDLTQFVDEDTLKQLKKIKEGN